MNEKTLCDCFDSWSEFIDFLMARARRFSVLDWGMLKLCLVSFGAILGSTFTGFFRRLRPLLMLAFLGAWVYTMWRIFFPCEDEY